MNEKKIKVSAPRENPHICYVDKRYAEKIARVKKETGMSLYSIICSAAHRSLDSVENIKDFRLSLKNEGFKTIGAWVERLIDFLYDNIENVNSIDFSSINIKRREK